MALHVGSEPLIVSYDEAADVLYISIGPPKPSYAKEDSEIEGLCFLHSVSDGSLCGVTVVWYSEQDKEQLRRRIPFGVKFP